MGLYDRDYMRAENDPEYMPDSGKGGPGRGALITIIIVIVLLAIVLAYVV